MNSEHVSNTYLFTLNGALFYKLNMTFQKHNVLQRILRCFSQNTVFTMNYTPCGWEPFWDLFGTGRGQWRSKAELGRAEPSRAEPRRARAEPR